MANDKWQDLVYVNILPSALVVQLNSAVSKLAGFIKTLTKFIKLLALFITAFNSFATLLKSFITYGKKTLNSLSADLGSAGVYMNILVPPAFLKPLMENQNFAQMSNGGFDGFIGRLRVSLNNSEDINAPRFSDDGLVGGFIILLDAPTMDIFFQGWEFLKGLWGDLISLVPINTEPMPPRNLRASTGYFEQTSSAPRNLGVKIEWDAPNVVGFTHYRLSRSPTAGGNPINVEKIPTKLIGPSGKKEQGLLVAAQIKMATGHWPTQKETYLDPDFNGGSPVIIMANPITGGGSYIDYEIDSAANGKYFYVVESGFSLPAFKLWGPKCSEIMVPTFPKNCISENEAIAIDQPNGVELIHHGFAGLGQWSSITIKGILPFLPTVVDLLNTFLDKLAGSLKTNSKAFVDFITGIENKMKKYVDYLNVMTALIVGIENFFSTMPRLSYLNVLPEKGGMDNFMKRIVAAKRPAGGFTDKSGITSGIVFVYGAAYGVDQVETKKSLDAINKAFKIVIKILS